MDSFMKNRLIKIYEVFLIIMALMLVWFIYMGIRGLWIPIAIGLIVLGMLVTVGRLIILFKDGGDNDVSK